MKIYDPKKFKFIYTQLVTGYMDESFIKVVPESSAFIDKKGCNGEVVRVPTKDKRTTITVNLMQTSPSNSIFSTMLNLDYVNGMAVAPVFLKDNNGKNVWFGLEAWVLSEADVIYSGDLKGWQWQIRVKNLTGYIGGTK